MRNESRPFCNGRMSTVEFSSRSPARLPIRLYRPMKACPIQSLRVVSLLVLCAVLHGTSCTNEEVADEKGSPIQRTEILHPPDFDRLAAFGESEAGQIDRWLEGLRESAGYPGLAVAIVGEERVLYQGAVGYADIDTGRKFTPDTLWHVASVTKAFTCTLAAKLHDRSVIDLDSPAIKYLPEGVSISTDPEIGATITLWRQGPQAVHRRPRRVARRRRSRSGLDSDPHAGSG